jgi:hypothetical protein
MKNSLHHFSTNSFFPLFSPNHKRVEMSSKTMTGEEELTKKRDDLRDNSSSSLRQKSSESLRQGSTGLLSQRSFGSQRSRVSTSASTGSVHGFLHFPLG